MRFSIGLAALIVSLWLGRPVFAAPYTFTFFDVPVSNQGFQITGFNNTGQILGTSINYGVAGFLYSQATGAVTVFALTDPYYSRTGGINDAGQAVIIDGNGNFQERSYKSFVAKPGPTGANIFAGVSFNPPYYDGTVANTINNADQIVGNNYSQTFPGTPGPAVFTADGFIYNLNSGEFTNLSNFHPIDINNVGEILGSVSGDSTYTAGDYLRDPTPSSLTLLNDPNATFGTTGVALNDREQVVGYYIDANHNTLDFLFDLTTGTYTTLAFPTGYTVAGINNAGQIVGTYPDGQLDHGFIATPQATAVPEPASLPLLGAGALGLYWTRRRINRSELT